MSNTKYATKKNQTHVSYDFGAYKVVIRNSVTNEFSAVRPRKVFWGASHERLMHFSDGIIAVLKKLDRRSFPEKTYEIVSLQLA